jgi:hypothetical protein
MFTFTSGNKKITVYPALAENRPVIYLTTYNNDGGDVYAELQKLGCPDFTLVTISGLNWEAELSPWAAGDLFKYSEMFTGGADAYLKLLTQEIMPQAESMLFGKIAWRGLARATSNPKRAKSYRAAPTAINSIPQQLVAKVSGHSELLRPQLIRSSKQPISTFVPPSLSCLTMFSRYSLSLKSS